MAEGRLKTLRAIWRYRVVRWAVSLGGVLATYDVLCNQLGLPPIKTLVSSAIPNIGVSGSLIP